MCSTPKRFFELERRGEVLFKILILFELHIIPTFCRLLHAAVCMCNYKIIVFGKNCDAHWYVRDCISVSATCAIYLRLFNKVEE